MRPLIERMIAREEKALKNDPLYNLRQECIECSPENAIDMAIDIKKKIKNRDLPFFVESFVTMLYYDKMTKEDKKRFKKIVNNNEKY